MAKDEQHPLTGTDEIICASPVQVPAVTRETPFRIHARMPCSIFQVSGGVPVQEVMEQLHLLNIWVRDLADELALAREMNEEVSEASLVALRVLTAATTALSESIC